VSPRYSNADGDLLAQCQVETYCASGPGGQNVNRRDTAVRLRHQPSGIMVTCQRERSQYMNKMLALEELRRRLERLNRRRIPRIPTKVPRSVHNRILAEKKTQSQRKSLRKKPSLEE
jgi:protein subunit release factor B